MKVGYYPGAANRDTRKWSNPTHFDIKRRDLLGQHAAFGFGAHNCIGQMIARLEAECILSALARRVRVLEISSEPSYRLINTMRTLENLPLRLTPA
jgi:cytochrome P450